MFWKIIFTKWNIKCCLLFSPFGFYLSSAHQTSGWLAKASPQHCHLECEHLSLSAKPPFRYSPARHPCPASVKANIICLRETSWFYFHWQCIYVYGGWKILVLMKKIPKYNNHLWYVNIFFHFVHDFIFLFEIPWTLDYKGPVHSWGIKFHDLSSLTGTVYSS